MSEDIKKALEVWFHAHLNAKAAKDNLQRATDNLERVCMGDDQGAVICDAQGKPLHVIVVRHYQIPRKDKHSSPSIGMQVTTTRATVVLDA